MLLVRSICSLHTSIQQPEDEWVVQVEEELLAGIDEVYNVHLKALSLVYDTIVNIFEMIFECNCFDLP